MSDKQIDPGNEVSKVKPHSLDWIISILRKWPEATLARGEAALLLAEIDRLRAKPCDVCTAGHGHVYMGLGEEPGR